MKKVIFLGLLVLFSKTISQEIKTEQVFLKNGAIQLPGELTYPDANAAMPLVLFIHGSGNVDRNGNQEPIIKANYIKQLAEGLNAKGVAFYRYDKRTATKENLSLLKNVVFEDLVADAKIAINHLATDQRFSSIHLIGHSQGSLVVGYVSG